MGATNFWNPQGLSRPLMGLLYLMNGNTTATADPHPLNQSPVSAAA